jgi:MoaA/NifB/PqqE/SkfB family radical SAM enzyme
MTFQTDKPLAYAKMQKFDDMLKEGKSIAIMQLQYNYQCNFYCSHCSIAGFRKQRGRKLDVAKVAEIAKQADEYGLAQWGLSGGEPLTFPELPRLIEAMMPDRFHIQLDTNGWLMTKHAALWLKNYGVDKVQISLDGMDAGQHDSFRNKPGSHARAIQAMDHVRNAGMQLQIATVVDHERANSEELERFFQFCADNGGAPSVVYAKPVGEWAGRYDLLCNAEDIAKVKLLLAKYGGYDHTSIQHNRDLGCLAVKRIISITRFGDVLPCPWMYTSLGNLYDEPLSVILERGMRYFGEKSAVCRMSEDRGFADTYGSKMNDLLPRIEEVM